MKKMLLAALALLITGCAQQTFTVRKQANGNSTKGNIHHHFFVSGIELGFVDVQPKFVAAQKMLLKRNQQNIRKWIAQFFVL